MARDATCQQEPGKDRARACLQDFWLAGLPPAAPANVRVTLNPDPGHDVNGCPPRAAGPVEGGVGIGDHQARRL